jgi:hypothetical protein
MLPQRGFNGSNKKKYYIIGTILVIATIVSIALFVRHRHNKLTMPTPVPYHFGNTWDQVKQRPNGISDRVWSARIFDAIFGVPAGTTPVDDGGSVNYNSGYLTKKMYLDEQTASNLCANPCYWHGKEAEKTGLCKCDNPARAVNFNFGHP